MPRIESGAPSFGKFPPMRALKTLLIILVALVAVLFVLYLIGPAETHMVRKITVNAPASAVYHHINDMERIDAWSPWRDQDSTAKVTFQGERGTVGSSSQWEGKMLGKGSQTITSLEKDRKVGVGLHFLEPFNAKAGADFELEPLGDSTQVIWHYDAVNPWLFRIAGVFRDSEAMMGPIFESGLQKLKALVEAEELAKGPHGTFGGYTITTVERPALSVVGKRSVVKWAKMDEYFGKTYQQAAEAIAKAGGTIQGPPTALYFKWDEANQQADMLPGFPVATTWTANIKGFDRFAVEPGKALFLVHKGDPSGSMKAHMAVDEMLKAQQLTTRGPVLEEYVVGPPAEPDTTKWVTNIFYYLP